MTLVAQLRFAWRTFQRARRVKRTGFRRYDGTLEDVCRQIIRDAYRGGRFQVSSGHFQDYYVRDFAFICEALVALGYKKEVRSTLEYALSRFGQHGRLSPLINPDGKPYDYFMENGPETIGLLLYSITHTGNAALVQQHREFLQKEVDRVVGMVDTETLLPRTDKHFSTIRDQVRMKSSCYDAVMVAVVAREARRLGLRFPYTEQQIKKRILETYWNGTYFFSDIRKQPVVTGEANVFPFWTGIISDKKILENAMTSIQAAGLDDPMPLRYVGVLDVNKEKRSMHFSTWFSDGYETDSIWMHLGLCYLRVLSAYDPARAKKHLQSYTRNLKRYGTFLELYDRNGEPFQTSFYVTDEAMSWCAAYLHLAKQARII